MSFKVSLTAAMSHGGSVANMIISQVVVFVVLRLSQSFGPVTRRLLASRGRSMGGLRLRNLTGGLGSLMGSCDLILCDHAGASYMSFCLEFSPS